MEGFNFKNTFFSCVTFLVLILSMLFFYEPAQNLLCSLAIFERFLINTPKVCSLFDATRLSRYNGDNGGKIYLSILGIVFDVTEGKRFYGPGGSYNGFSGELQKQVNLVLFSPYLLNTYFKMFNMKVVYYYSYYIVYLKSTHF